MEKSLREILIELSKPATVHDISHRIELAEYALENDVCTKNRAALHVILGNLLVQNTSDNSSYDLEKAIKHCNDALDLYNPKIFPYERAITQNSLANAYCNRKMGSRIDNLERAIELSNLSLEVLKKEKSPNTWSMVQYRLGNAYRERIKDNKAKNIEKAIQYYEAALEVRTKESSPEIWAEIINDLANAYIRRIEGDKLVNVEKAISRYKSSLRIFTLEEFPFKWASINNNLAVAYLNGVYGDKSQDIEHAIHYANEARKGITGKDWPEQWASILINMAACYYYRIEGNRANNLEWAIRYCNEAIEVYKEDIDPERLALIQNNLAAIYLQRPTGDREDNIYSSIYYSNEALKVRIKEKFPKQWADTQYGLGNVYRIRVDGDRAENIELAIEYYKKASEIYRHDIYPRECRKCSRILGDLYFEQDRWKDAADIYQIAILATERLYHASILSKSKEAELLETGDLYRKAAYSIAKCGQKANAIVLLEQGRARDLGDALAHNGADIDRIKIEDPAAYNQYRESVEALRRIESNEITSFFGEGIHDRMPSLESLHILNLEAQAKLDISLERIRRIAGYENFLEYFSWNEITDAVKDGSPLVYLITTPNGSLALIIANIEELSGSPEPLVEAVWLDEFKETQMLEMLRMVG
jgi:tetratricopeptide (TPR) repeat protein